VRHLPTRRWHTEWRWLGFIKEGHRVIFFRCLRPGDVVILVYPNLVGIFPPGTTMDHVFSECGRHHRPGRTH
jgi:hypothetical protein